MIRQRGTHRCGCQLSSAEWCVPLCIPARVASRSVLEATQPQSSKEESF